jgi:hypothetical protein
MKNLRLFHAIMIVSLVGGFIFNNIGELSDIGVLNNLFLILITFSYLFANLFGYLKK